MKSPRQASAKSTPKAVSYTGGKACCGAMASGRASPTSKKQPVLYNKPASG